MEGVTWIDLSALRDGADVCGRLRDIDYLYCKVQLLGLYPRAATTSNGSTPKTR